MDSHPREACGIFGIFAPGEDVARLTFFGLFALQHRGQESAGIATSDYRQIHLRTAMGLVTQVFDENVLEELPGDLAIGHTRYSTTGASKLYNAQPFLAASNGWELALGHNGNVVNAQVLREQLLDQGYSFHSASDSEVIAALIVTAPGATWEEKVSNAMRQLEGAYSLVALTRDRIMGIRDPLGVRPLCLGKLNGGYVLASETCALSHLGADLVREVEPGEVVTIDRQGLRSVQAVPSRKKALCIFEYIYFARPDSIINGKLLYPVRQEMGRQLAQEHPVDADLVIGVPDSATASALGYAQQSGIPYSEGLVKNRYVGRTFIQPDQRLRDVGVRLKFNPLPEILAGKRVVMVDDSIVRGTTTPHVVHLLRNAGAAEVHVRICAPPIRHPCYFGVDMATRKELVAAHMSIPEIARFIGADSLGYLSIEGLLKSVGLARDTFCMACFSGSYPMPIQLELDKLALEGPQEQPFRLAEIRFK